ncbi:DUF4214 domain-containing protein [Allomesorhizobium alhagi]|uniref:DUF4214 domain-containing protein n=1 Tax=Mesorhizobium alhagi CCNWXJ12-2 TaxID=1107882 RepID=H0HYP5_9HYPH|nr:DUF4214 domain-containing protein [Mesorhizobium alhagi]EHK54150.1 hypothetical protein MAXJ12_26628 [Mesorhizobium alhagi CCNWXJ12-2]
MFIRISTTVACMLATTTVAATADFLWGVNGHPITAYPGVRIERQLDFIEDLGLKSYRVNISSEDNADDLAALVAAAKKRGIEMLPVITPQAVDLEEDSPDELYGKAKKVAVTLATRFKDEIRVWELGNEMENHAIIKPCENRDDGTQYPCAWGPAGGTDALDYYGPRWVKVSAVLKGLSDGITAVDPGIKKAMGTAGWGHVGAFARMNNDGIDWDISVWHMYGEDPEWAFREIAGYGKPIWVTEFNHPLGSQRGERQQAEGIKQTMTRLRELQSKYKVEAAHIYELLDETYWAPSHEAEMGLVRLAATADGKWAAGEPKPAYKAVRDFVRGPRALPEPKRDCDLAEMRTQEIVGHINYGYCLVLGRAADMEGTDNWREPLKRGDAGVTEMLLTLIRSDEFTGRYGAFGLSDRAYISFLYRLLLDRDADQHGLDSYAKELRAGAMSRENVAYGIMISSEFQSKHPLLYNAALDTEAPPPG